jgi:putative PIN family toxin of toxin-antitoxin system
MNNVILDTNIIISALMLKNSLPAKVLNMAIDNYQIVYSEKTFLELQAVLMRQKFDKFILQEAREDFLILFLSVAKKINIIHQVNLCRDAKDNKFLDLAINSEALYLITGDQDLLVMKEIDKTKIITPVDFINA